MPRTKPAVRVHISIAHHNRTADTWATLEGRAILAELLRLAGERFAGKTKGRFPVRRLDRQSIACVGDQSEADRRVREVCRDVGWRVDEYPNRWDVTIRNFVKKQGFGPEESDTVSVPSGTGMSASESESESDSKSEEKSKRASAQDSGSSGSTSSSGRGPLIPKPDTFPPESMERLRAWAKTKGYSRDVLNAGLAIFREWEPVKPPYKRPIKTWEGAFKRITREAVGDGSISKGTGLVQPEWCDCTHQRNDTERATEKCRNCGRKIRQRRPRR